MSTKDEAAQSLIYIVISVNFYRICQRLYKIFLVFLKFGDVLSKESKVSSLVVLGLVAFMQEVSRTGEMLDFNYSL